MARILIVDDDADVLETLREIVGERHQVEATTDSLEAYRMLKEGNYDLLLTDIRMPGMNGFMLARAARKLNPKIRVMLLSAYYDEGSALSRSITGRYGDAVYAKPMPAEKLEEAIGSTLTD